MLGDNFFYSADLSKTLSRINRSKKYFNNHEVNNPSQFGVLINKKKIIK